MSKTISFKDREINFNAVLEPTSAQIQLWLAQMKRDHSDISDNEMAKVEQAIAPMAKKAKTIYNPFTGEIRKVYL
ncbi:MAG: hypothetical protein ACXV2C_00255 [Candidatus Bathyarchaeia archaeon]